MDPMEMLIEALHKGTPEGKVFRIKAPIKATVLLEDEQYRKRDFAGGEELFFQGAREGKSGKLVFEFTPTDAAGYTQVEFTETELEGGIADASAWIEAALSMSLPKARKHFVGRAREEAESAETRAKAEQADYYANNPNWGSW